MNSPHASLTLMTTSNTEIGKDVLKYATARCVILYQSIAAIDESGNIRFRDPERLNDLPNSYHQLQGVINAFDFDVYDTHKPVNPLIIIRIGLGETDSDDPDPALFEDF
jgi:hypothetical protein